MCPHFKKADRWKADNYRPVSNTVHVGVLTEHIVHEQQIDRFDSNRLFHNNHHGNMATHDTCTAMVETNFCLEAAEGRKFATNLLIDQTAAFDLVDHLNLQGNLETYGGNRNTINWFGSYLAGRSFKVHVEP